MKNVLRTGGLILVALALVIAYLSTFIVDEREKALVVRFGEIQRTVLEPGLYFKLPFSMFGADEVIYMEDRMLFFESQDKRVQVRDGRRYLVDTITMFRIIEPQKFRESVGASLRRTRDRLETRLDAGLRATYGKRSFEAALSQERLAMMREIRDTLRPEASELGIEIVDVRIRRTDLTQEVSEQTFERMKAERLAEAELIRARGREAAQRIRAVADRQVVALLAEAQRESEILRGEGEGERNRIFAEAFSQDQEFFEFYRSMAAYRQALEQSGTTMVLSPDSDFFRFFQDPQGLNRRGSSTSSSSGVSAPLAPSE